MQSNQPNILVFGGLGGVGSEVVSMARLMEMEVWTTDNKLSVSESPPNHWPASIDNSAQVADLFRKAGPFQHVVVASGINLETKVRASNFSRDAKHMMEVNYVGPIVALQAWLKSRDPEVPGQFVVVSSNSASIPRSQSMGYCASKAALSMAIRCAARAEARSTASIWGVEPGWIDGTAMSARVAQRIGDGQRHRIPGNRTQTAEAVAGFIMAGIGADMRHFNGVMFRLDGGEV